MICARHPRRESAIIIDLPEPHLDCAAAREVIRHEVSTRQQLMDACHVLANYGDWCDMALAREVRNILWAQRGSDLRPAAVDLAEARQINTIDAAFVRLNAPTIRAERRKSRADIMGITIAAAIVAVGITVLGWMGIRIAIGLPQLLAMAEYMRGM